MAFVLDIDDIYSHNEDSKYSDVSRFSVYHIQALTEPWNIRHMVKIET